MHIKNSQFLMSNIYFWAFSPLCHNWELEKSFMYHLYFPLANSSHQYIRKLYTMAHLLQHTDYTHAHYLPEPTVTVHS